MYLSRTTVKSFASACPKYLARSVLKRTLIRSLEYDIPTVCIHTNERYMSYFLSWMVSSCVISPLMTAPTFLFMWEKLQFLSLAYPSAKHSSESESSTQSIFPGVFCRFFHIRYIKLLYCRGDKTLLVMVIMPYLAISFISNSLKSCDADWM